MSETIIALQLTSITPILINNVRLANPTDSIKKRQGKLNEKKLKKTEEDREELRVLEFAGGLYYAPEEPWYDVENSTLVTTPGYVYLPSVNLFRCFQDAARLTKKGRDLDRGVYTIPGQKPELVYDGPKGINEMYNDPRGRFVDSRMVNVAGRKIERIRPIFREWTARVDFEVDPQIVDPEEFIEIAKKGGKLIGIGNYRTNGGGYGRFTVDTV